MGKITKPFKYKNEKLNSEITMPTSGDAAYNKLREVLIDLDTADAKNWIPAANSEVKMAQFEIDGVLWEIDPGGVVANPAYGMYIAPTDGDLIAIGLKKVGSTSTITLCSARTGGNAIWGVLSADGSIHKLNTGVTSHLGTISTLKWVPKNIQITKPMKKEDIIINNNAELTALFKKHGMPTGWVAYENVPAWFKNKNFIWKDTTFQLEQAGGRTWKLPIHFRADGGDGLIIMCVKRVSDGAKRWLGTVNAAISGWHLPANGNIYLTTTDNGSGFNEHSIMKFSIFLSKVTMGGKVLTLTPPKKVYKLRNNGKLTTDDGETLPNGNAQGLMISTYGNGNWIHRDIYTKNIYAKFARDMHADNYPGAEPMFGDRTSVATIVGKKAKVTIALNTNGSFGDPAQFTLYDLELDRDASNNVVATMTGKVTTIPVGSHKLVGTLSAPNRWTQIWLVATVDGFQLKFSGGTNSGALITIISEIEIES